MTKASVRLRDVIIRNSRLSLVGENGAGKSTLIKILSGVHRRDAGQIRIDGEPVEVLSPHLDQTLGIIAIYYERNRIPHLSVEENILLGDEPVWFLTVVQWNRLFERAAEIAKALYKKARIVIMDEPTASLAGAEIDNLFRLIGRLQRERVSVIYISHPLDEIFQIADAVSVLRDARKVLTRGIGEITKDQLGKAVVGEELSFTRLGNAAGGETLLSVESLSR